VGVSVAMPRLATADEAGALFDQGLAAMAAEHYDVACPKLAESFRLDPHAGGLFTLAECENKSGKLVTAYADYARYLDLVSKLPAKEKARQEPRVKVAIERRAGLERDLPHVTIGIATGAPAGSTVTLDGTTIVVQDPPVSTPLNLGEHLLVLHAPDGRVQEQRVTLARGENRTVNLALEAEPVAPPPVAPSTGEGTSTRTYITYAAAGVGGLGIVTGAILGAVVFANKSSIDASCPTPSTCNSPSAASTGNTTRTLAAASTGTFIVGGAALAGAAVLFFTRPSSSTSTPHVGSLTLMPSVAPTGTERGVVFGAVGRW
jgi:hypothetical protein